MFDLRVYKNLGVIFDFFDMTSIAKLKHIQSSKNLELVIHALVIHYCDSVYIITLTSC